MVLFACMLLALGVSYLVLQPASPATSRDGESESRRALQDQRERCVQVLKDLELDFATQKISVDEYDSTKQLLTKELSDILLRLDKA